MKNDKEKFKKDNLNIILDAIFKFAKNTAKEFYFKIWVKNPPKCPAFDGEVIQITRSGWEHIIDETSRTKTDVMGRLFVLERAKALLEKAVTFAEIVEREKAVYWVFDGMIKEVRIRVVVKSYSKRPKYFLTVIKKGSVEKYFE